MKVLCTQEKFTPVKLSKVYCPSEGGQYTNKLPQYGAVLVSTGVVRPDKRAVAPDHDKTGNFLNLTDNRFVAQAA